MTYSIVARDDESGMLGVGIQSHFFAAASVVVYAEAGVGAICTQAFASRQYGGWESSCCVRACRVPRCSMRYGG